MEISHGCEKGTEMEQSAKIYRDLDRILVTKEEIAKKVKELGQQITRDYEGKQPVLVCILKGASFFYTDLCRATQSSFRI